MKRLFLLVLWVGACFVLQTKAQGTYPPHGLHKSQSSVHAFVNCTLVPSPGQVIEDGVLIIRNGLVENAGKKLKTPPDAVLHDLNGAWVYPGFIDAYSGYGIDKPKRSGGQGGRPQYKGSRKGPYAWNDAVRPEHQVAAVLKQNAKSAAEWRKLGFTTVNVVPNDGIFRGTGALLNLGNGSLSENMLQGETSECLSFQKGSSKQQYPSSLMGGIALIRQTFHDAEWYGKVMEAKASRPNTSKVETNLSLQKLVDLGRKKPFFFECRDYQDVFRASKIAEEFGLRFIYKTSGDSYKRLEDVKALGSPLIVPLSFPQAYEVGSPSDAREVSLRKLMHWEQAPLNPAMLARNGLDFALTTNGLKKPAKEFWAALQRSAKYGFDEVDALAALTTVPAKILGQEKYMGALEPGKIANFLICEDKMFGPETTTIYETWVNGRRHINTAMPIADVRGAWDLTVGSKIAAQLLISGKTSAPSAKVAMAGDTMKAKLSLTGLDIVMMSPESKSPKAAKIRLVGLVDGNGMGGLAVMPSGEEVRWSALRKGDLEEKKEEKKDRPKTKDIPLPNTPFGPYGFVNLPAEKTCLIQNATVWTNTGQGVLENADVLIRNGKIAQVGKGLSAPGGAEVVDGTGKHITPGIIDEHSHIGISRGVNEGSHAVTAEVRIGDVVDGTDVNIYRQLAGGVTTSQLLHGSANPIGGQSAIIKLRWGQLPEAMKFEGAPGFIKFALGENVKQSNWGDQNVIRYPQTRLGVEQLIQDAFDAARNYERARNANNDPATGLPARRDLQMEALLEILKSKRFVTCHSYVQSEITMLMQLAEANGFRINTFTHVLEGFKIADKLAKHGATGSTFSDWWAYKYEVIDAIPYNAALMHSQGVNVCINSDDAEMGRRLNQEAAKMVKYGGVSEEEALKMVTLNPAKALHIDHRVGSIESGKDGDVVLWSDHPLSIYAQAEKTFIDGRLYFDRERDLENRKIIAQERTRLINKMMLEGKGGGQTPSGSGKRLYHCDTFESDYNHE